MFFSVTAPGRPALESRGGISDCFFCFVFRGGIFGGGLFGSGGRVFSGPGFGRGGIP